MNLGALAGGIASGYKSGQSMNLDRDRLKMQQDEAASSRAFRERQMKMSEQEHDWKAATQERESAMQKEAAETYNKYYGPRQVEDGVESVIDPATGAATQKPKFKTVQATLGQDPIHDLNYRIDMGAQLIQRDPKSVFEHYKQIESIRDSQVGKDIMGVLSGDADSMGRLGKQYGFDPAVAKVTFDPKTDKPMLMTGTGKNIDLSYVASALSVTRAADAMREREQAAQAKVKTDATVGKLTAETALTKAEADLMPRKGNLLDQQAFAARGAGQLSSAKANSLSGGSGISSKVGKDVLAASKTLASGLKDAMGQQDPQATNSIGRIAMSVHADGGGKIGAQEAAIKGKETYLTILSESNTMAEAAWKDKNRRKVLMDSGYTSPSQLAAAATQERIAKQFRLVNVDRPVSLNERDDE